MKMTATNGMECWVQCAKGTPLDDVRRFMGRALRVDQSLVLVDDDMGPAGHAEHRCIDLVGSYVSLASLRLQGALPPCDRAIVERVLLAEHPMEKILDKVLEALRRAYVEEDEGGEEQDTPAEDAWADREHTASRDNYTGD